MCPQCGLNTLVVTPHEKGSLTCECSCSRDFDSLIRMAGVSFDKQDNLCIVIMKLVRVRGLESLKSTNREKNY